MIENHLMNGLKMKKTKWLMNAHVNENWKTNWSLNEFKEFKNEKWMAEIYTDRISMRPSQYVQCSWCSKQICCGLIQVGRDIETTSCYDISNAIYKSQSAYLKNSAHGLCACVKNSPVAAWVKWIRSLKSKVIFLRRFIPLHFQEMKLYSTILW